MPLLQANIDSNSLQEPFFALFVSTFSCDWILIWQALCQDCADAIELEWGQAPAISGINTVIMSAARFKRRFALTVSTNVMQALQPKWYIFFYATMLHG